MLAIHVAFLILAFIDLFQLNTQQLIASQLGSALIMLLSVAILFFRHNGNQAAFTFRFLILTTVQMLGYLSILLAFIYTNQDTVTVFYLLALALAILVIQTSYLVRRLK
ncbi:MAG: hypothetical protein RLZZ65_1417 [Bacteroidota bacterium]|jgi:hypothetical protein